MTAIKYWDGQPSITPDNTAKREQADKLKDIDQSFNSKMFDMLTAASGSDPMFDIFNSNSSDMTDLFSDGTLDPNLQSKLGDLQNEGMGKVWAAKMANVLPSFDAWSSNDNKKNDNSSSMGGLDSFIELTVKMQMAQAKKAMQHETKHNSLMSLEEFMGLEKVEENQEAAVAATDNETVSQDQFAKDIYAQIQAAAGKYDTTIDELKSQIFSAKS